MIKDELSHRRDEILKIVAQEYQRAKDEQLSENVSLAHDADFSPWEQANQNPAKAAYRKVEERFNAEILRWNQKNYEKAGLLGSRFNKRFTQETIKGYRRSFELAGLKPKLPTNTPAFAATVIAQTKKLSTAINEVLSSYSDKAMFAALKALSKGRSFTDVQKELSKSYMWGTRRAGVVSRDEANSTTNNLTHRMNLDLGLNEAVWVHIPGRWYSRAWHEKMHGKTFDQRVGMWDEKEKRFIQPGELRYCQCCKRVVIPDWMYK